MSPWFPPGTTEREPWPTSEIIRGKNPSNRPAGTSSGPHPKRPHSVADVPGNLKLAVGCGRGSGGKR